MLNRKMNKNKIIYYKGTYVQIINYRNNVFNFSTGNTVTKY